MLSYHLSPLTKIVPNSNVLFGSEFKKAPPVLKNKGFYRNDTLGNPFKEYLSALQSNGGFQQAQPFSLPPFCSLEQPSMLQPKLYNSSFTPSNDWMSECKPSATPADLAVYDRRPLESEEKLPVISPGTSDAVCAAPTIPSNLVELLPERQTESASSTPRTTPSAPAHTASAVESARQLHEAMDGPGTTETTLRNVLLDPSRSPSDRGAIASAYEAAYGGSLRDDIAGETSWGLERDLLGSLPATAAGSAAPATARTTPSASAHTAASLDSARRLHEAMDGIGTDEATLRDVLLDPTRSAEDRRAIASAYEAAYGSSLRDDVAGETSWGLERDLLQNLE